MTDQERAQHVYDLLKEVIQEVRRDRMPPEILLPTLADIQADMIAFGAKPVVKETASTVDWSCSVIPQGRTRDDRQH
jgi:hypothetical protein